MSCAPRVLLVSSDASKRDAIGERLEACGYEVTSCPGPQAPSYICVGIRCGECPLVHGADAAIVDGWLTSDEQRRGVPSWHLARTYWGAGLPVVYLVGPDGIVAGITTDRLVAMPRSTTPAEVVAELDVLVGNDRVV